MSGLHNHSAAARHRRPLTIAFVLVVVFMLVEVVAGFLTRSLALLSDAGHMATDAIGLGMALAAISLGASRGRHGRHTYGMYRLEILAALANSILLLGVGFYVLYEAIRRLQDPPEVLSGPMLVVAVLGLIVNIIGWWLLREGSKESINVEGAFLEVLADLIGSVGVIAAALILRFTGWAYADPLFGAAIGLFIVPRAFRLGRRAVHILVQGAPHDVDLEELEARLAEIPGVVEVHDLHVWTLTSDMDVASVHLVTREGTDPHPVLDVARHLLETEYGIDHATLQVEPDTHRGCAEVSW